jgi:hypothetical protein
VAGPDAYTQPARLHLRCHHSQVRVCFKTSSDKSLPLKRFSDRSSAADACHEMEMSTEYKLAGEQGDEVVAPEDTVRAYRWVAVGCNAAVMLLWCANHPTVALHPHDVAGALEGVQLHENSLERQAAMTYCE